MNRAVGEIGIGLRDGQRAIKHIKSLHRMANIHDLSLWSYLQDHALHGPYEVVAKPKIGGHGNDRTVCQCCFLASGQGSARESKVTCSEEGRQDTEVIG